MKEYIYNEKKYIEDQICRQYVDENNPTYTIKNLARYNHYILGLNKKDNYDAIDQYMRANCDIYTEIGYSKIINGCIRDVKKRPFADIDKIIITTEELERIKALNDDRKEKLSFVLLADAKYHSKLNNINSNVAWITTRDLYKLARVTMPYADRAMFLSFLYDEQLVEINFNPKFSGYNLLYVSDDQHNVGIVLTELNYKELAFTYMNWKYGGYKECEKCGRLIKIRKGTKYCKGCAPRSDHKDFKIIQCADCGTDVVISIKDTKTCRCGECYDIYRRKKNLEAVKKYQLTHSSDQKN